MKRTKRRIGTVIWALSAALVLATCGLAGAQRGGGPGPGGGRPGPPPGGGDGCAMVCMEDQRECMDSVRDAVRECATAGGCDALREDLRAACGNGNRGSAGCASTRDAMQACIGPCHEASHEVAELCRAESRTCLEQVCDIDAGARSDRPGRFQRPDRPSLGS